MQFVDATEECPGVLVVRLLPVIGDHGSTLHPIHAEITEIIEHIRDSRAVRAAVITGTDDVFYAGPPLRNLAATIKRDPAAVDEIISDARRIVHAFVHCEKPIVSAVNGLAIGLGCQLAFFSDFCFAVESATFQDTHVRVGLPAGDGGTLIYPLLFGLSRAKRYLMMGERLSAAAAVDLGGVESIVAADELMDVAIRRAQRLTGANHEVIKATKTALHRFMLGAASASFEYAVLAEKAAMRDPRTHEIMEGIVSRER